MDEKLCRISLGPTLVCASATGSEAFRASRKMRAGEICCSCKSPLPQPNEAARKRCASCASKHHVHMIFFRFARWHCRFTTERWQPLSKRLIFRDAAKIRETARRGNGLIDDAAREALELAIEIGRGGITLRLTDEQYRALADIR